jgi:sugar/nucleoside kinase (ribokinase family)
MSGLPETTPVSRTSPGHVCVVGSLNLDTTLRVATLPGPGQTTLATGRSVGRGGKGANQAVAARWQGSDVTLVAAVGEDNEGRASLDDLRARGIDVSAVQSLAGSPTGAAVVLVAEDGENLIVVDPGANAALHLPGSMDAVDRCARELDFAGTLIVTLGSEGSAVYSARGRRRLAHLPATAVDVVDTTGAGDAFCGVLADQLARGVAVIDAVKQATRLAALSTTVRGAQVPPTLPPTA